MDRKRLATHKSPLPEVKPWELTLNLLVAVLGVAVPMTWEIRLLLLAAACGLAVDLVRRIKRSIITRCVMGLACVAILVAAIGPAIRSDYSASMLSAVSRPYDFDYTITPICAPNPDPYIGETNNVNLVVLLIDPIEGAVSLKPFALAPIWEEFPRGDAPHTIYGTYWRCEFVNNGKIPITSVSTHIRINWVSGGPNPKRFGPYELAVGPIIVKENQTGHFYIQNQGRMTANVVLAPGGTVRPAGSNSDENAIFVANDDAIHRMGIILFPGPQPTDRPALAHPAQGQPKPQ